MILMIIKKNMENLDRDLQREKKWILPLLEVVKDKKGLKHTQKYSQIYILNFLIEKRVLSDSREKLIWQLKNNTNYTTNKIMELIDSYFLFKEFLPEFNDILKDINYEKEEDTLPTINIEDIDDVSDEDMEQIIRDLEYATGERDTYE